MKIKQVKAEQSSSATGNVTISGELQTKLKDMTINQALAARLIDDIGDEKGNFLFNHADASIERKYAIIQGAAIGVSKSVGELEEDELLPILGNLTFRSGISTIEGDGKGKSWFNLGMPSGVRLGESTVNIAESVEELADKTIA